MLLGLKVDVQHKERKEKEPVFLEKEGERDMTGRVHSKHYQYYHWLYSNDIYLYMLSCCS